MMGSADVKAAGVATIIKATAEDVPRIIPCAREYTDIIPGITLNEAHYVSTWQRFLNTGLGVIFLAVAGGNVLGGIGGVKCPEALTGDLMAVEIFWYTGKDNRGDGVRLYNLFEQWARDEGCRRLAMIYLPCSMPERLDVFYRRKGFALRELHYEKELN